MSRSIQFALLTAGLACAARSAAAKDQPDHAPGPFVAVDGAAAAGKLATKNDKDFFRFQAVEGERYSIYTAPAPGAAESADTIVRLYNAKLHPLASNDDGPFGTYSLLDWTAPKTGTYHLRVTGYGGDKGPYRLWLSTADGTTPPAVPLEVNADPVETVLANPLQSSTFTFAAIPGWHYVVRVESPSEPDLILDVSGANGIPIATGVFSQSELGVQTAGAAVIASAELVVRVRPDFASAEVPATFTVQVEGTETDDHPGDWPGTPFSSIGPKTGWLADAGDADAFQFTAIGGLPYDVHTYGPADTVLEIVDANGVVVASDDDGGLGLLAAVKGFTSTETALYLARVRLGTGAAAPFGLSIASVATDDFGGSASSAATLLADGNPEFGIIDCAEDSDWFSVYVTEGQTYHVGTGGAFDTVLHIWALNGSSLLAAADDVPGSNLAALDWTAPYTGFVYVAVDGFSSASGPYSVWME